MSRSTTFARSLIKTAVLMGPIALAATSFAPALADSGPQQVLYIFPGFTDNGGAGGTGVASVAHCFSFSPAQETLQIIVRDVDGSILKSAFSTLNQFQSVAIVSHATNLYSVSDVLLTGPVIHGVLGLSASSTNIVCTAQIIDASATVPNGIDLHGTRFNPIAGSQE